MIEFYKLHGAGNDFIFIDGKPFLDEQKINELCQRRIGIGADGLIFVENIEGNEKISFKMHYFNSDGREVDFCGNGGRCAVYFAKMMGFVKEDIVNFQARDGMHIASFESDGNIKLQMISPFDYRDEDILADLNLKFNFVNTGVEHTVIKVKSVDDIDVEKIGKVIRYDSIFKNGTNVNFIEKINHNIFRIRTYERGVEGETLACGTGVCAGAYVDMRTTGDYSKRVFITKSNTKMEVEFDGNNLYLLGPAEFVYKGIL